MDTPSDKGMFDYKERTCILSILMCGYILAMEVVIFFLSHTLLTENWRKPQTCLHDFWCWRKRWSNIAPYSSWIRCISLMCSATFSITFSASVEQVTLHIRCLAWWFLVWKYSIYTTCHIHMGANEHWQTQALAKCTIHYLMLPTSRERYQQLLYCR